MDEAAFFEQLRQCTDTAFQQSPVRQKQDLLGRQWNYSLCATPIRRGRGVLFGLNWGGGGAQDVDTETGKAYAYPAQAEMPDGREIGEYRFIRQALPYLNTYLKVSDPSEINYTNLCFFRSPAISDLQERDWELSLPLFREFVEYVNPPWLLMLGTSELWKLQELDYLSSLQEHSVVQGTRTYRSYSAEMWRRPFVAVPHPQARLRSAVRSQLWKLAWDRLNIHHPVTPPPSHAH